MIPSGSAYQPLKIGLLFFILSETAFCALAFENEIINSKNKTLFMFFILKVKKNCGEKYFYGK